MEQDLFHHHNYILHLLLTLSTLTSPSLFFPFPILSFFSLAVLSPVLLDILIYIWAVYFRFPARLALLGLGWAMQNIEPDAADMYLSLEL
jgi:hypothetical protein